MIYIEKSIDPVNAVLWTGDNFEEVLSVCPQALRPPWDVPPVCYLPNRIPVNAGDYVIETSRGIYTKMNAEIFLAIYKLQEEVST